MISRWPHHVSAPLFVVRLASQAAGRQSHQRPATGRFVALQLAYNPPQIVIVRTGELVTDSSYLLDDLVSDHGQRPTCCSPVGPRTTSISCARHAAYDSASVMSSASR